MWLTDLTSLNDSDDAASVRALAVLACSAPLRPAAVCIWARWIPVALEALQGTGIRVCAVANFPNGAAPADIAAAETAAAVAAGATEVDVVFPYRAMLAGDSHAGLALVRACREACGEHALLKVILETGQLPKAENIRQAAEMAIDGGAHFLKTSTGKTQPAATPEAAAVLCGCDRGGRPTRPVHRLQGFRRHPHDGGRLGLSHALRADIWLRGAPPRAISASGLRDCSRN